MSRLIDADEFEKRIKPYDTADVMDKALYNFAHNQVICTPTACDIEQIRAEIADAFIKHGLGNTKICFNILQIIDKYREGGD